MKRQVDIVYSTFRPNPQEYLQLSADTSDEDVMERMRKYYAGHFRGIKMDRSLKTFDAIANWTKKIVQNQMVFMGSDVIAEAFRQIVCSWSVHPSFIQVMKFRDSHQGEVLTGFHFRVPRPPKNLVNKLWHAFEGHIPFNMANSVNNYIGIELLPDFPHHRQRQLLLCQRQTAVKFQKDQVFASDAYFFTPFFEFLLILIFIASIALLIEKCVDLHARKSKSNEKLRLINRSHWFLTSFPCRRPNFHMN